MANQFQKFVRETGVPKNAVTPGVEDQSGATLITTLGGAAVEAKQGFDAAQQELFRERELDPAIENQLQAREEYQTGLFAQEQQLNQLREQDASFDASPQAKEL